MTKRRSASAAILMATGWLAAMTAAGVPVLAQTKVPAPTLRPTPATPPSPAAQAAPQTQQQAAPQPAAKPAAPAPQVPAAQAEALKQAIRALRKRDYGTALKLRGQLTQAPAGSVFDWIHVRDSSLHASAEQIAAFVRDHPDWPHEETLRARLESALFQSRDRTKLILATFDGSPPVTGPGKAALALAYKANGDKKRAAKWAHDAWVHNSLTKFQEDVLLAAFADVLDKQAHKARLDMLLYRDLAASAARNAERLGAGAKALTEARIAVSRRAKNAEKLLNALPKEQQADPVAQLSRIQYLRRKGQDVLAAGLLLAAPQEASRLIDTAQWWEERRILARRMLDLKDPDSAYRLAAEHATKPGSPAYADAEFHAGWVALRYLDKPGTALAHFENMRKEVTTPISVGRAEYWMGRAREALRQEDQALAHFEAAAAHPTVYYGQLASLKLNRRSTMSIEPLPAATPEQKARFDNRAMVRAARLLARIGEDRFAAAFLIKLAYTLDSAAEISLAGQLARSMGLDHAALRIGKIAAGRNITLPRLAFLTGAIPPFTPRGKAVEPALVHAVARQESIFNPAAVSPAGARGLMQLMPATARLTAKRVNVKYVRGRLTSDPAYNAMLGSAHLGDLIDIYDGSYIMTIAAYNAGPRRVRQWAEKFGDPRRRSVDPIDWVERIPFTETRNYVQRVLENLQVYRARLNGERHRIGLAADLKRGR